MIKRNILLNPGPATTTDSVKMAQVVPDICHREKEFCDLLESICKDLTKIVKGEEDYTTVLFCGSGTAGVEAVINSVVPPGKRILIANNGAYGERMRRIAQAYKINCIELKSEWYQPVNPDDLEDRLKDDPEIKCIGMVHHETTTGLLNPAKKVGELAKKYGCTYILDTISSFAGLPIDVKEINADFMMATSNKCIQGMAGVCFVICKKEELEKIKNYPRRSFYLSLYDQYNDFKSTRQLRFTPPVQTMYALRKAIDEFLEEGAENRFKRYTKNWETLRHGMEDLGFKILTEPKDDSHILISVLYPENPNFDFDKMHDSLYQKGFTIYPGKVGDRRTFRLANLGAIDYKDIRNFLGELKVTLDDMGVRMIKT